MATNYRLDVRRKRTIESAWRAIQRNGRLSKSLDTRKEIAEFAEDAPTKLRSIQDRLLRGRFIFAPARGVKAKKSGSKADFRPLVIAPLETRIVQRAIHDVLVEIPAIAAYVRTPYSFGGVSKSDNDEFAAVPAAIKAVKEAIENGAKFIVRSDISQFFTRISKSQVRSIVADAVNDQDFMKLFDDAVHVELSNMDKLRRHAARFPIEDIGVAQGSSLSPLLGNILLSSFDRSLNEHPDVKCIRYIDDFVILAPTKELAENTFSKACALLKKLNMEVSAKKTQRAAVFEGFEFVGVQISPGLLRPTRKAQEKVIRSVSEALATSIRSFREHQTSGAMPSQMSLLETLSRVGGITLGWSKHYAFCNDERCFQRIDQEIAALIRKYLAAYRQERNATDDAGKWRLLGITSLAEMERSPFIWASKSRNSQSLNNGRSMVKQIAQD